MRLPSPRTCLSIAALAGVALAVFDGCGAGAQPAGHDEPGWVHAPLAASAPAPVASIVAVPALVSDPSAPSFDPARITPVVDDPRLAEVKTQLAREAYKGAADALAKILRDAPPSTPLDEARWQYQTGALYLRSGLPVDAVRAFDRAAAIDWPLADHARLHAGDLLIQLAQPSEGLARLAPIQSGTLADEVALARAAGHVAARDVDAAGVIYSAYLSRTPRPGDWQLVALRFARALLNQPSEAHAEQAVEIAQLVIYQSPGGRGVGEAREIEQQALATLPSTRRTRFVDPAQQQLAERARDLSEARQGREAMAAADKALAALGDAADRPGPLACEAHMAKGRGLAEVKRYAESSDALGVAIERCEGSDRQVVALFVGARSALRGGKLAVARQRYASLEKQFPDHSYADDARLHGAEAARDLGDVAAFTAMLQTIADAYPQGDMVDEALFTLARDRIEAGDWAGALTPLEKAVAQKRRGRPYYAEGRPQYYLARARSELGQPAQGRDALIEVVRQFPLSYYMMLAYGRLHADDPAHARAIVHDALRAEPDGDFIIADHAELHRPGFVRATELVRQGDGERALVELEALGVRNPDAHPALVWAAAFLLARIDAPAESHGVLRASTDVWQEHFPAGIWRPIWEVAYPRPFKRVVEAETKRSGIPEHLAYAIMREESAFKPRAVSSADAVGLMQLILPTAKSMARPLGLTASIDTLKTPETNIALGCRFLSVLQRRFDYNPLLAVPGYNAGPGAPTRWLKERPEQDFDLWVEAIPYRETRRYTKRVLGTMAAYGMLYGSGMGEPLMVLPVKAMPDGTALD